MDVKTLIAISQATLDLVQSISDNLFDGDLRYQLVVLPPENGSIKWSYVLWVAGGLLTFVNTDVGKGFVKGLTDKEPGVWAEQLGNVIKNGYTKINPIKHGIEGGQTKMMPFKSYDELFSTYIMCQIVIAFLEKEYEDLQSKVPVPMFVSSYKARNDFYEACISDVHINGLGFTNESDFPIKRRDFIDFIVPISTKDEVFDSEFWSFGTADINVTSPNWDRADRSRSWKGRDASNRERIFRIEDDRFWTMVEQKKIDADIIDHVKVQWVFQLKRGNFRNHKVLRVLEYNGKKISDPIEDKELEEFCKRPIDSRQTEGQLRLNLD